MRMILLGPPGAGKGTLSGQLAEHLSVPHLASGDILRGEVSKGSDLGLSVQGFMDSGQLVPDDIIIKVMISRLTAADCAGGYILDGFPRTLPQAQALNQELIASDAPVDLVIYLDADAEIIVSRLAGRRICPVCQANYHVETVPPAQEGKCDHDGADLQIRPDDDPKVIRTRLEKYAQLTEPLLDYYAKNGRLCRLDGNRTIEQVCQEATQVLTEKSSLTDGK